MWTSTNELWIQAVAALTLVVACVVRLSADEPSTTDKPADELLQIGDDMRTAAAGLTEFDSGPETQAIQTRILQRLIAEIDELGSSGGQQSLQPTESPLAGGGKPEEDGDSSPTPGGTETADRDDGPARGDGDAAAEAARRQQIRARELVDRQWGTLPKRLRQSRPAGMEVEFLPKYRELIEAYYERLANEQRKR
jgi:hypothetical protein